jgi:hypothetical protein
MNHDHQEPTADDTDRFVSELLDQSHAIDAATIPQRMADSTFDALRATDLLWINALLEQAFDSDRSHTERSIERAMTAIRDAHLSVSIPAAALEPGSSSVADAIRRPSNRQSLAWISALSIVLIVGLWLQLTNESREAQAAVARICRAAAEPADREYLVTFAFAADHLDEFDRQVLATLFVRSDSAFVAKAPAVIRTADVWFGRNRNGLWIKPAVGPVLSGPVVQSIHERFLPRADDDTPVLQMTTVLNRLSDRYNVQLLDDEIPARGSLAAVTACRHIRGTLRSSAEPQMLPDAVEIHADQASGNVIKLVLTWHRETATRLKRIDFDFVRQSKQPDDWYFPDGHRTERTSP